MKKGIKVSDELSKFLFYKAGEKDLSLNIYCANGKCKKYDECANTITNGAKPREKCIVAVFPTTKEQAQEYGVDREEMFCGELGDYKYYIKKE